MKEHHQLAAVLIGTLLIPALLVLTYAILYAYGD